MTTLVTGATSGLGRNAVEYLRARGLPVRATGRNARVGAEFMAEGIDFIACDLVTVSVDALNALLDGVNAVWHCAALSSPWGRQRDFDAINVHATQRLSQAAAERGVRRFVHVSTPSIYFDYAHRRNISETFRPARFVNHYARSKAEAEDVIRGMAARYPGTTFTMLRPRGIFGPHDAVLLPRIIALLRERRHHLPLPRGGTALLDLTYAENVVHAMHLATCQPDLPSGEAFNITNGEPITLRRMLDAVLPALGIPFRIAAAPYPLLDLAARAMEAWSRVNAREPLFTRYSIGVLQYDMTLDIGKAQRMMGYQPIVPLAQAIDATQRWIRSHGDDYGL